MPRTPAPLTVTPDYDFVESMGWRVQSADGITVAFFYSEADARAFVALPVLVKAARDVVDATFKELPDAVDRLHSVLAAADGPSPKE